MASTSSTLSKRPAGFLFWHNRHPHPPPARLRSVSGLEVAEDSDGADSGRYEEKTKMATKNKIDLTADGVRTLISSEIKEEIYADLCAALELDADCGYDTVATKLAAIINKQVIATSDPSNDNQYGAVRAAYRKYRENCDDPVEAWQLLKDMAEVDTIAFENKNRFGNNEQCVAYIARPDDIESVCMGICDEN
jgi:hypothetical protein